MTYAEKYAELHLKYQNAGKELEYAIDKLSEINGFGDLNDLSNYSKANRSFKYAENLFENLLKYITDDKINTNTEFNNCDLIYDIIKQDQLKKGIALKDLEPYPNNNERWKYYICNIGLTNSEEIINEYRNSIYLFPVLSLKHGKECYTYLNNKLLNNIDEEFDIENLNFSKVDTSQPIFIKILLGVA